MSEEKFIITLKGILSLKVGVSKAEEIMADVLNYANLTDNQGILLQGGGSFIKLEETK